MTVHPSPYHIKVARSVVDTTEEQTRSGLHVVRNVEPGDQRVLRGIVEEVGSDVHNDWSTLEPGHVLFYTRAIRLGDHDFVLCSYDSIIAWEDS